MLHWASAGGHLDVAKLLLDDPYCVDVHTQDDVIIILNTDGCFQLDKMYQNLNINLFLNLIINAN